MWYMVLNYYCMLLLSVSHCLPVDVSILKHALLWYYYSHLLCVHCQRFVKCVYILVCSMVAIQNLHCLGCNVGTKSQVPSVSGALPSAIS